MRLPLLVSAGVLLVALLPCPPCRALLSRAPAPGARQAPQSPQRLDFLQPPPQPEQPQQPQPRPVLLRMGEEYFLRLGNLHKSPAAPVPPASSLLAGGSGGRPSPDQAAANFFRVLLQQLLPPRRSPDSPAAPAERGAENALGRHQEAPERERRSEEPPISLDLTFHLLREVLEMARAEQLAQQAHSNRKLMEIIGK
ncbi:PREDICTED: corticoliberin [Propithecus coquereli]|uniref:corticoliberin n=1 Tax=Propithecus coquereli TaxID=379532 RepID=UPI00063F372F|nr:PREDICTED: corticoliberin [Propithecus coquereli]